MNARQLADTIDRFISDNRHSRDVDMRWLASYFAPILTMLGEAISQRGLGPEMRKLVDAFRAKEIEGEMANKRRELEILERDLGRIKTGTR